MNSFEEMLQKQSDLEKERDLLLARVASLQADKNIRSFMVVCHERDCARGMLSLTRDKLIACEDALEAARADLAKVVGEFNTSQKQLSTTLEMLKITATLLEFKCIELVAHREKAHGNYWAWQGDGEDHLESLSMSCPVVISAEQLKAIINARDSAREELVQCRRELDDEKIFNSVEKLVPKKGGEK